jgi:hypothetical protein
MYEAGGEGKPIEKKELVLEEGEIFCDRCNGSGDAGDNKFPGAWRSWEPTCSKCWGTGKLNWIENVFGKEFPYPMNGTSGSSGINGSSGTSGIFIPPPQGPISFNSEIKKQTIFDKLFILWNKLKNRKVQFL